MDGQGLQEEGSSDEPTVSSTMSSSGMSDGTPSSGLSQLSDIDMDTKDGYTVERLFVIMIKGCLE